MGQIKRKKRKPFTLDTVAVGTGANCPKCGRPMQRRRHVDGFKPPPGMRYWYACVGLSAGAAATCSTTTTPSNTMCRKGKKLAAPIRQKH